MTMCAMAIVTQTDKRTDITYAYETQYHWDKEKKQSRSKRVCVGKVDPTTGKIISTRGKAKKKEKQPLQMLIRQDQNHLLRQGIFIMALLIYLINFQKNLVPHLI